MANSYHGVIQVGRAVYHVCGSCSNENKVDILLKVLRKAESKRLLTNYADRNRLLATKKQTLIPNAIIAPEAIAAETPITALKAPIGNAPNGRIPIIRKVLMLITRPIILRGVFSCMSVIDTADVTACAAAATSSKLNESQ
jgi:hypothetical protein